MHIIGICGPSCSGKSTIAEQLITKLNANHFCLDDYYILGKKVYVKHEGKQYRTFESPEVYDGTQLAQDIYTLKTTGTIKIPKLCFKQRKKDFILSQLKDAIIIEGFLIYRYPEITNICTHMFFIDTPHSVIKERRAKRNRSDDVAEETFNLFGLQEWQKHGQIQKDYTNVISLDGTLPVQENISNILNQMH